MNPVPDRRRTRQFLLFLANVASGVVAAVATFFSVAWTVDGGALVLLLVPIAFPAVGRLAWRSSLEARDRPRDQAAQVAGQAFRILIAWEAAMGLVPLGFFVFFAFSAMAPVPHTHDTAAVVAGIVILATAVLVIWFTWTRSRRMLDLLWPLPGVPQAGSESPYTQLKL